MFARPSAIAIMLVMLLTACAGGTDPDPRAPSDATGDPTDQTGDQDDQDAATGSEGDVAEDAARADDADDEPIAEVGSLALGTATVTVGDETFEFLVFGCFLTPAEDPSGLFEFAGASAAPEVPRGEIEASLAADAADDRSDPDATIARNLDRARSFLSYGPTFGWQRWLDGSGDVVALMLDESTGWVSEVEGAAAGDHAFIAADGQRFTGSSEVVQFPSGRTAQLSFSADCP